MEHQLIPRTWGQQLAQDQPVMLSRRPQNGQGMSRVKSDKMVCTSSKDPGLSWMELAIQYACNKNDVT